MKKFITILITITTLFVSAAAKQKVDLLVLNGKIYTVDKNFSQQSAIAVNNGKIVATGTTPAIQAHYESSRTIDLNGKTAYPGFIDAHCHFTGYALDLYKADLTGTKSYQEVLEKLATYENANHLPWLYGRGWDQNDWTVKQFPDKQKLDSLFPDKPVILKRIDGHVILCNSKALQIANIDATTRVNGGVIMLENGAPNGILLDNAMQLVERIVPNLPDSVSVSFIRKMQQNCFENGLTCVVDCGLEIHALQLLEKIYAQQQLSIGITALILSDKATMQQYLSRGTVRMGQFQISGIKIFADGSLGSRGACLLQPYTDDIHNHGMLLTDPKEISVIGKEALQHHWQLCTHAIGDSTNRTILKLYGHLLKAKNDKRWRIEHAQLVHPADFHLFGQYNIIPSVQPTHALSDMPWVAGRLGAERMSEAYAYKQLLGENGWIALGTDFPVEAINPIATFYTAVFRQDKDGNPKGGFLPANALSRQEALKGMTIWAAKSVFREKEKGSLEPGKDADIVIYDCDLMQDRPEQIIKAKPVYTIVKGKIVYQTK